MPRPNPVVRLAVAATLALSALGPAAPSASAAGVGQASPASGRLDVVIRHDGDGTAGDPNADSLVHLSRIDGRWTSPRNIGGTVHRDSEIGLTSPAPGTLALVVRGTDDRLRARSWSSSGGWGSWTEIASGVTAGPSITAFGSGKALAAWRDSAGRVALRQFTVDVGWGAAGTTTLPATAGAGPVAAGTSSGGLKLILRHAAMANFAVATFGGSGSPTDASGWGAPSAIDPAARPPEVTPVTGVAPVMYVDPSTRTLVRLQPATGSVAKQYVAMGGPVAGSAATARAGESIRPNTPASTWSARVAGGSLQADLTWRSDNGCLQTRTKTDTAQTGAWTATARLPTQLGGTRCVWPGRVGMLPLFRRMDSGENADLQSAHDSWLGWTPRSGNVAMDWYTSRDAAVGLHQGPDWAVAWAPRNWHPNPWFYRKGTSYLDDLGLHLDSATATKGFFVRRTDTGAPVAINYGCSSSGCPQPLLNVTSAAARRFWLKGPNGIVVRNSQECHGASETSGVLDLMACSEGARGTGWAGRGNYRGVWIDDVLTNLRGNLAGLRDGRRLTDAEVDARLPFTQAQWQAGIVALLEELKAGIAELKAPSGSEPPSLLPSEGQVAINYKWTSDGYGSASTSTTISSSSTAARTIRAVDFIALENGWIDGSLQAGQYNDFTFQRRQRFVDQVHALGTKVLEEKTTSAALPNTPSCSRQLSDGSTNTQTSSTTAAHYTTAQYNYAATLLNYVPGDWVGDMCELVGRGWDGYGTELGAPLGGRTLYNAADPNGLQVRRFERGRVVVNPPRRSGADSTPVTFAVAAGSRWRPTGSNVLTSTTSITLAPRQGAVILEP